MTVPKGEREYHGGSLGDEKILEDDECPLAISVQHAPEKGNFFFLFFFFSAKSSSFLVILTEKSICLYIDLLQYFIILYTLLKFQP